MPKASLDRSAGSLHAVSKLAENEQPQTAPQAEPRQVIIETQRVMGADASILNRPERSSREGTLCCGSSQRQAAMLVSAAARYNAGMSPLSLAAIKHYLDSRPRLTRWMERLRGRRYRVALLGSPGRTPVSTDSGRTHPLPVAIAHAWRDAPAAARVALALEADWPSVPASGREAYETILACAPGLVVLDLRRTNRCGCLGHRHPVVREQAFAEPHEALGGVVVGEIDLAWQRVEAWPALPLEETALDARFFEGSRLDEFRSRQFRLRLLSVVLHEINHLVFPHEPEESVRGRSLAFYRDALQSYVEETCNTLSFTIDRSFSRME